MMIQLLAFAITENVRTSWLLANANFVVMIVIRKKIAYIERIIGMPLGLNWAFLRALTESVMNPFHLRAKGSTLIIVCGLKIDI